MTTAAATERLLTVTEVAERCQLSAKTVYRAIERGEIAAHRICSRIRVRESEIEAWITRSRVVTEATPLHRIPVTRPAAPAGSLRALLAAKSSDP